MKYARILTIALILFVTLSLAGQFTAFAAAEVSELSMTIRPEYDKAKTVFIWGHGKLAGSGDEKIGFVAPKDIDDNTIHICQLDDSGQTLKCFLREKDEVAGGYKISATVTPNFKTEYYYPVTINGSSKSTSWTYETDFDVKKLTIQVAEPRDAKNFKVSRKAESTSTDDENFKLYNYTFSNVKAGEKLKFDISYQRSSNEASVEFQGGQQGQDTSSKSSGVGAGAIIAAVIAAIAVAGGVVFGLMYAGSKPKTSRTKRPTPVAPKVKARFCTNCGSRLSGGKFCPNCGAAVK